MSIVVSHLRLALVGSGPPIAAPMQHLVRQPVYFLARSLNARAHVMTSLNNPVRLVMYHDQAQVLSIALGGIQTAKHCLQEPG
jgi:hypothetical protein